MPRNKSSKKKSMATKVSKYVIPPMSPVGTRSKSSRDGDNSQRDVAAPPEPPAAVAVSSAPTEVSTTDTASLVKDLEQRWDVHFAKIETAIRSGLSSSSRASSVHRAAVPPSVPTPTPPSTSAVPEAAVLVEKPKSSKSSRSSRKRHKHRHRTPSPVSSSDDDAGSSSSSSSSSSESETENDSSSTKKRTKKKGKYDSSRFLPEGKRMDTFERMTLANLKMALKLLKKKRNIKGLLQHMIMVSEKAETGMFL